jgi:hypothetical protein
MSYFQTGKTYTVNEPNTRMEDLPQIPHTVAHAAQYAAAEVSGVIEGTVTDEVYATRLEACVACPARKLSTQLPDMVGYCGDCGCGVNARSRLTVKLRLPSATCPRQLWMPTIGKRVNALRKLWRGIVKKLIHTT